MCFFPNSNSFGVFSHRKGFGAELLLHSLWFSGGGSLGRQKVPRKVPPRFFKFRAVAGSLGQIRFGLPKGSVLKGSVEGSPRFYQGFTEVPPRFDQGCASS